jgi:hypothetical protein
MISFLSPHRETHYDSQQQQQQQQHKEVPHCTSTAPSASHNIMKTIHLTCNNMEELDLQLVNPKSIPKEHDLLVMRRQSQQQLPTTSTCGLTRTRTVHSSLCVSSTSMGWSSQDSSSSSSTSTPTSTIPTLPLVVSPDFSTFGMDIRRYTGESPNVPVFDSGMRQVLEPHMRKARLAREEARQHRRMTLHLHDSIASSVGVPYVRLRTERPFLYDTYTHPMHQILAETLGVDDLTRLHLRQHHHSHTNSNTLEHNTILAPLKCRETRRQFQESYDNFVTSFCIPLLHSMAMSHDLFHGVSSNSENTRISYRYQAFPNIRVVRPGDTSEGPLCDTSKGHNVGFLHFHIPLTPSYGTNALYTESYPGREDWHPLQTKSTGLGFFFDGGRCLHFNMENTTESTSVALDFVVGIYYSDQHNDDDVINGNNNDHPAIDPDGLCNRIALEDQYSLFGPGYYDEALIDIRPGSPLWQYVAKKQGDRTNKKLLDPDVRNGFPFA